MNIPDNIWLKKCKKVEYLFYENHKGYRGFLKGDDIYICIYQGNLKKEIICSKENHLWHLSFEEQMQCLMN